MDCAVAPPSIASNSAFVAAAPRGVPALAGFSPCRPTVPAGRRRRPRITAWAAALAILDAERQACLRAQLRDRLQRFTCSSSWAAEIYSRIEQGSIDYKPRQATLEHAVGEKSRFYPPGGPRNTAMRRCRHCHAWMPPGVVGSDGICYDCFVGGLPLVTMVCIPSARRFTWSLPDRQAGAHGLATVRRSRRSRWRFDDRQICGGPIDEQGRMLDPRPQLPAECAA